MIISNVVFNPIWNFEKFLKLNIYCNLTLGLWLYSIDILIIEWYINMVDGIIFYIIIYSYGKIFKFKCSMC